MREYGSVSPQFWIGKTGKALRGKPEAQVLALYLMTSPHANMIGVFHCPVLYMAHETGLGFEGASKALASLIEVGFCLYDEESETVFVIRMAAHQVGENLKHDDNKVKGVQREVSKIAVKSLKDAFIDEYAEAYHLKREAPSKPLRSPKEAPSKQLTGTGQEQNQEQEQEQEEKPRAPRKPAPHLDPSDLVAEGVDLQHAKDWRTARKSPITPTAWEQLKAEAAKAGISPAEAVRICAIKGWRGFESSWNWRPNARASPQNPSDSTAEAARLLGFSDEDVIDA